MLSYVPVGLSGLLAMVGRCFLVALTDRRLLVLELDRASRLSVVARLGRALSR